MGAYNSWGGAVDYCVAHGAEDLCPLTTICPDGPGAAPVGGRRTGRNGDDQWTPYGGDGDNRWVQTGVWGGDPQNTCTGHHVLAGDNPAWGAGDEGVSAAGYMDWVMCCGEGKAGPPQQGGGH